jgi:asparagine synthase (glutamine-hydrolysing)
MSVQFGRWNFDGRPVDQDSLERVGSSVTPYGPEEGGSYSKHSVVLRYRAFHTTKESRLEVQPHLCTRGALITWDGRLDNRAELTHQLRGTVTAESTDVSIVAAAYEEWGCKCFAKLIGDWALSIWDERTHSLILAKDPIGTRHLYYALDRKQVTWCTILDPLVLFADQPFSLNEEYIAGWLSFFPATHLTPYGGILSVPPCAYVLIRDNKCTVCRYWNFDPGKRVRYKTDAEYEEHFRDVFAQAVRRRLRSDSPILAELSGGIDSSSIVCVADTVIAQGLAETPRLDTVSYYDDFEPNWNERPYFTKVEEKRKRTGCHISVAHENGFPEYARNHFSSTPRSGASPTNAAKQFMAYLTEQGNRVVLSGIGGDEVTGGVPSPTPELEDLLARVRVGPLVHQLKLWALNKRKPWFHLLFEAARGFLPHTLVGVPRHMRPARWLDPRFVKNHRTALLGYPSRLKFFGAMPSFQDSVSTLSGLQRQLGSDCLASEVPYEKRYPFLDRELLEFLYAVPREQLLRPGHRRSLMRRALIGIVPDEILNRKRKAFVSRAPIAAISSQWHRPSETTREMVIGSLGIIDQSIFAESTERARRGEEIPVVTMMRTLAIEYWLCHLKNWCALELSTSRNSSQRLHGATHGVGSEDNPMKKTKGMAATLFK